MSTKNCGSSTPPSPYDGLFDAYVPLEGNGLSTIGRINAELVFKWNRWVHRRVDELSFSNEDVVQRSMSIDFTIPSWAHDVLNPARRLSTSAVLVPLTLVRKGVLAKVDVRDESDSSIPLLTRAQNGIVAEASLLAVAEAALQTPVPYEVACDLKRVSIDPPTTAYVSRNRLLNEHEQPVESKEAREARTKLREVALYRTLVDSFVDRFLAIVILDLKRGDRRIITFSYEELLLQNKIAPFLRSSLALALGNRARRIAISASGAGQAESYHIETVAPAGLQISSRIPFTSEHTAEPGRVGSYDRSHLHFQGVKPREEVAVLYRLRPRPATIVRSAFMVSLLSFAALLYARLGIHELVKASDAAAAILVAIPGILSVAVSRSDDNAMTTDLLLPLRFVSILPGIFAFIAAGVLAIESASWVAETILWTLIILSIIPMGILCRTWIKCSARARRRDEPDPESVRDG